MVLSDDRIIRLRRPDGIVLVVELIRHVHDDYFSLEEKVVLVRRLFDRYLSPGNTIIMGDIAFETASAQDQLHLRLVDEWDEEFYWIADETIAALARAGLRSEFHKVSICAGVFLISQSEL